MSAETKLGRPTKYSQELADYICEQITEGRSLRSISTDQCTPDLKTICRWLNKHESFCQQYIRARAIQAHIMAEEIFDIADDSSGDSVIEWRGDEPVQRTDHEHINRSRLRVDTRKWYLSKVLPKLYGDRLEVNSTSEVTHTHIVSVPRLESREEWLKAIETTTVAAIGHDDTESD